MIDAGRWHHVAYTSGAAGHHLYVDGARITELHYELGSRRARAFFSSITESQPTYIGRVSPLSDWVSSPTRGSWSGYLDEVTVWSRPLDPAEIAAIHAAGSAGKCHDEANPRLPRPPPKPRANEERTPPGSAPARASASAVSATPCPEFERLKFDPLPASTSEIADLAALFKSSSPVDEPAAVTLQGPVASETAFKALAPGRRLLHLATHGFALEEGCRQSNPSARGVGGIVPHGETTRDPPSRSGTSLLSGLALAGANHRDAADPGEEDGILMAEEIVALDLSGVEWAVLSACDTGVGRVTSGEGVLGLRRAFRVAGVRTLIMSLWSVEDESARHFMKALYEARLIRNRSTADSMHEASVAVLRQRRARGESVHPFYWAGFVAAGDWR
jgi:hypothetical protein